MFAFPGFAGSTKSYVLGKAFGADIIDFAGYIGIVPFVLFVLGALVVGERPVRWLLLAAGAVTRFISFHGHVPPSAGRFSPVSTGLGC
jgi:hypothetical protein